MRTRFPALVAVSGPTLGYLGIGLSGFALLAAGPRLLGPSQYGLLAVAWTLANVLGIGLATPGEQAVSRATASRQPGSVANKVRTRLLFVTAGVVVLPLAGQVGLDPILTGSQLWAWAVVLASFGWALAAPARGTLAGRGEFSAYAWTLGAEAASRIALVGLAWAGWGARDLLLALSVGFPLLLSAVVARLLGRAPRGDGLAVSGSDATGSTSDQFWYTAVAFSTQIALALPAVALQAVDPLSGAAGSFVTASVYMRIPITLVGGLLVVVLSQVARYQGAGLTRSAARVAGKAMLAAFSIGVIGTVVLMVLSEPALQILYGGSLGVSQTTLLLLGCATVAAMMAGVGTQTLFGCGLARPTAAVWMGVAVGVVIMALTAPGTAGAMAWTVLLGQVIALMATSVLLPAALRSRPTPA